MGLSWIAMAAGCMSAAERPASAPDSASDERLDLVPDRSVEVTCLGRPKPEEQLCRADRRLMEARRSGDEVAVRCYEQRGRELRASHRVLEEARAGDAGSDERARASIRAMDQTFTLLEDCERGSSRFSGSREGTLVRPIGREVASGRYADPIEPASPSAR